VLVRIKLAIEDGVHEVCLFRRHMNEELKVGVLKRDVLNFFDLDFPYHHNNLPLYFSSSDHPY
jgi:hypothetical protein